MDLALYRRRGKRGLSSPPLLFPTSANVPDASVQGTVIIPAASFNYAVTSISAVSPANSLQLTSGRLEVGSVTTAYGTNPILTCTLGYTDAKGAKTANVSIFVDPATSPLVIGTPPTSFSLQQGIAFAGYNFTQHFQDRLGNGLTYAIGPAAQGGPGLPGNMTFTAGVLNAVTPDTSAAISSYFVSATNTRGEAELITFSLVVASAVPNQAPVLVNQTVTGPVAAGPAATVPSIATTTAAINSTADVTATNTYTSGAAVSVAAGKPVLVAVVLDAPSGPASSSGMTAPTVTLDGNAVTQISNWMVGSAGTGSQQTLFLGYILNPSAFSGNLVVTVNGATANACIGYVIQFDNGKTSSNFAVLDSTLPNNNVATATITSTASLSSFILTFYASSKRAATAPSNFLALDTTNSSANASMLFSVKTGDTANSDSYLCCIVESVPGGGSRTHAITVPSSAPIAGRMIEVLPP